MVMSSSDASAISPSGRRRLMTSLKLKFDSNPSSMFTAR